LLFRGPANHVHIAKQPQNVTTINITRSAKVGRRHPIAAPALSSGHDLRLGWNLDDGAADGARVHQGVNLAKGHAGVGLGLASALFDIYCVVVVSEIEKTETFSQILRPGL
jgi:hypothetical protein